jgi:hypothetical protein
VLKFSPLHRKAEEKEEEEEEEEEEIFQQFIVNQVIKNVLLAMTFGFSLV